MVNVVRIKFPRKICSNIVTGDADMPLNADAEAVSHALIARKKVATCTYFTRARSIFSQVKWLQKTLERHQNKRRWGRQRHLKPAPTWAPGRFEIVDVERLPPRLLVALGGLLPTAAASGQTVPARTRSVHTDLPLGIYLLPPNGRQPQPGSATEAVAANGSGRRSNGAAQTERMSSPMLAPVAQQIAEN